jgi:catechol 2,3-dioxygenase-like lactoylglutathione lyase family enzyme
VNGLETVELKAFVPAKDYARSLGFYRDLGFELAWDGGDLA